MLAKKIDLTPSKILIVGPNTFQNTKVSSLDANSFNIFDKAKIMKELLNEHRHSEIDENISKFCTFSSRQDN